MGVTASSQLVTSSEYDVSHEYVIPDMTEENMVSECIKLITFCKGTENETEIFFNEEPVKNILSKIDFPVYILAFTGEARIGKSTFINSLITYITKTNNVIFKTSATIEHCTIGIDMCIIKTEDNNNYLILDVQGINHGDSSNDCKLMLIPYEISNMIIHNDVSKLNNATLKGLEPVNLFERYIPTLSEKNNKPILMFRVRDWNLTDSVEDALTYTLAKQKDQFEPLRSTISRLFSSVKAVKTESLEKSQITMLNSQQYDKMIKDDTSGFASACKYILDVVKTTDPIILSVDTTINRFKEMIKQINDNKKIDYTCLDISTLRLKNDLNEFMNTIDNDLLHKTYEIDCSNKCYLESIARKEELVKLYEQFKNMFDKSDQSIVFPKEEIIVYRIHILEKDIEKCLSLAYENCMNELKEIFSKDSYICMFNKFTKMYDPDEESFKKSRDYTKFCTNEISTEILKYAEEKDLARPAMEDMLKTHVHGTIFGKLFECYVSHSKKIMETVNQEIKENNEFLESILNLNHIKNKDNICLTIPYEEQSFRNKYHNDWTDNRKPKKYEHYCEIFFDITMNSGSFIIEMRTEKAEDNYNIDKFSNHDYYKHKIDEYFKKSEVFECYKQCLIEKIDELFKKSPSSTDKHSIIKAHSYLNFVICNTNRLTYHIDDFKGCESVIFLDKTFSKFIIDKFVIVDEDFQENLIKMLFSEINSLNFSNLTTLSFHVIESDNKKRKIACQYVINKMIEWYGKKIVRLYEL